MRCAICWRAKNQTPSCGCFSMVVFRYDKSWDGLLSCVFAAYEGKLFPHMLLDLASPTPLLAGKVMEIATDDTKAGRVMAGLRRQLSQLALRQLFYAWLSEDKEADWVIFCYMCKVFDHKNSVESNYSDPDVLALRKLWQLTSKEAMRARQFVRFQKTGNNIYFSLIEPACNVLPLVLGHFKQRFAGQEWVIYDNIRAYGFYYDRENIKEISLSDGAVDKNGLLRESLLAADEKFFQKAWQRYFQKLTIEERRNPRLQRQHMPRRFWRFLTEKQ